MQEEINEPKHVEPSPAQSTLTDGVQENPALHPPSKEPPATPLPSKKPKMEVELPELLQYKLLVYERDLGEAIAPIRARLAQEFEQILVQEINKAVAIDPKCIEARKIQHACVNEIMETVESKFPEGYAVTLIKTREGKVVGEYNPDGVGKRLPV
jgi:hypothetical protein